MLGIFIREKFEYKDTKVGCHVTTEAEIESALIKV